jgi:transposase
MARVYTEDEVQRLIKEATAPLLAQIAQLEAELARLKKDSSTSSKPPSSDIVKPPRPSIKGRKGRRGKPRQGGQPGHARHERTPFPPENIDTIWIYEWPESELSRDWKPLDRFDTIQQVDLVPKLVEVTEHRARMYLHRPTGKVIAAPLPRDVVRAGLVGPRLSALIAYQKGACHMAYRVIQTFLADVLQLELSTGQLAKVTGKASAALASGYEPLQTALPARKMVNVDGKRSQGGDFLNKLMWT